MSDITKTRIDNPNAKKYGGMVEHILKLRPCKILAISILLFMNNSSRKFEVQPLILLFSHFRPSLDDKLFQRDLVAALALSKGSSPDDSVIEIEDDLDVVDEKISKTETKVTKQVKDVDEKNIGNEEVKAIGKSSRKGI